eukprot:1178605-Prorocentrum_minimum.AAC.3
MPTTSRSSVRGGIGQSARCPALSFREFNRAESVLSVLVSPIASERIKSAMHQSGVLRCLNLVNWEF